MQQPSPVDAHVKIVGFILSAIITQGTERTGITVLDGRQTYGCEA